MTVTEELKRPPGIPAFWYQKSYRHHWPYIDQGGSVVGHVVRYEDSDGVKEFIPFFKQDGTRWQSGYAEGPRPLFGLDAIVDTDPDQTLYVAEGEKAAQAARYLGLPCVTSPGGSKAAKKAEWEPLARFQSVVILPDNDSPGREYAAKVSELLHALAGEREIRIALLSGLPEKGDLVDWILERVSDWDGYGPIPREPGDDLTCELLEEIKTVAIVADFVADPKAPSDLISIGDSDIVANVAVSQGSDVEKTPIDIPYPLESLGDDLISGAIQALHYGVQSPIALCANSVLAVATHAVQAHADLLVDGRRMPLSEYFLTIARTGERKTATDKVALREHFQRQSFLQKKATDKGKEYKAKLDVFEKERKSILSGKKKDASSTTRELLALEQPEQPLHPILIPDDITLEGLQKLLLSGQPSVFVANDEAGTLIGGHALNPDNILKSLAGFSKFWDGTPISRVRGGDGAIIIDGKRVTVHLQMQPVVAKLLLGNPYTQGQGFLSRCLIVYPKSTAGERFYREVDPFADPRLFRFHEAIRACLERQPTLRVGTQNVLEPRVIGLSAKTKKLFIEYYNHIEGQLGREGEYESVTGFANKAAEHALRLAGVITLLSDLDAPNIGEPAMDGGIALADYYMQSLLRLQRLPDVDPEQVQASHILNWMKEKDPQHLRDWKTRDIQKDGPGSIRNLNATEIRQHMGILVDAEQVEPSGLGEKTTWRLR